MSEIKLTKRYPHSRSEDITDAYTRGFEDGMKIGRGECTNAGRYIDGTRFECSRCGWNGWVRHASDGRDHPPKSCPECGAKVVDE